MTLHEKLSKLGLSTTTIKLACEAFIESVISFHLAITYKHLTSLNCQVCTAYKLSDEKLTCKYISEFYIHHLKTKCLRMILQASLPTISDQHPSN